MTSSDTGTPDFGTDPQQLRVIAWEHLDLIKFYPTAMFSSWSIRCLLYPMSVIKSRLQLQKQNSVYRGTTHAITDMVKTEGFRGLYRGFWVTLPQIGASFIYSTVYERLRAFLQTEVGISSAALVSAVAGAAASCSTQTIFVPTDIIAQHMMIHNKSAAFVGTDKLTGVAAHLQTDGMAGKRQVAMRIIAAIYHVDGISGFYRGFMSSALLYIPSSMIFWSTYYNMQDLLKHFRHEDSVLLLDQGFSAAIGGITAAIGTNALDVYRIRIQVHRTSYTETLRRMWRYEGKRALTKGLIPRMISNGTYSCAVMLGYESVKKICVLPEYRHLVKW
uniref:Solute carrier family 25 member 44 n=2 Tax=Plectus sambesii TaxID=2011161 RepID=A0A914UMF0_9BILA